MDCIDLIRQGTGRELSEEEVFSLFEQVKKEKKRILKSARGGNLETKLLEAVNGISENAEIAALAQKRALQLQADARAKAFDLVMNTFRGKEAAGLSSLLTGTNYVRAGSRLSVDAQGTSLSGHYIGGLLADIKTLGKEHMRLFQSGALDLEVARALRALDDPAVPEYRGPREAQDIARAIRKWQDTARVDENKAGAWIGKEPGYIVRQSHDRAKIRNAGFERWKEDIEGLLNWERTGKGAYADGASPEDFLREVFNDIETGVHLTTAPRATVLGGPRPGTVGSAAARASRERVLHFKDAESWFAYNKKYGQGNLRETLLRDLDRSARTTALMRVLGPSPQANFETLINDVAETLRARRDVEGTNRVQDARGSLRNQLKEVDGTLNIEGNAMLAQVGRAWRNLESMIKLGGALVSSITDIPNFSEEMAYQGRSYLGSMAQGIKELLHGRGTVEQQRILSSLGVFFDGMSGDVVAKFSGDELPGRMSRMMRLFFQANGLTWWTDSWRKAAGLMMSHDLALEKGLTWDALSMERRRVLSLYGLDAGRWDVLREGNTRAADGRHYLTPEAVYDVPDEKIAGLLQQQGKQISAQRIQDMRDEIAMQLRTFFRDRIDYAVISPDAKTRSILRQGTSAGTLTGEMLRFVTQFKSFPVAMLQKTLGRAVYGRGAESLTQALKNRHGEMFSFARLFLATTVFGYAAMTAKDMLKGRSPRDPAMPQTWVASALQGGALGIYGDFLFGARNRMGGGFVSSLAGPAASSLDELNDIYTRIRDGEDVAASSLRFVINHTPGNNLWWFRTAFDYLIGYSLFESLNPGYFDRMRKRVEKENSQTFWLRPSL